MFFFHFLTNPAFCILQNVRKIAKRSTGSTEVILKARLVLFFRVEMDHLIKFDAFMLNSDQSMDL